MRVRSIQPTQLQINTNSLSLGSVSVGLDSTASVSISNEGSTPLIITDIMASPSVFSSSIPTQPHRQALYLESSNTAYLQSQSSSSLLGLPSSNSSFTIEAWIKPDTVIINEGNTITYYGGSNGNNDNWFRLYGTQLHHRLDNDLMVFEVGDLSDAWHHVAVVYSSNDERRLYLDGELLW